MSRATIVSFKNTGGFNTLAPHFYVSPVYEQIKDIPRADLYSKAKERLAALSEYELDFLLSVITPRRSEKEDEVADALSVTLLGDGAREKLGSLTDAEIKVIKSLIGEFKKTHRSNKQGIIFSQLAEGAAKPFREKLVNLSPAEFDFIRALFFARDEKKKREEIGIDLSRALSITDQKAMVACVEDRLTTNPKVNSHLISGVILGLLMLMRDTGLLKDRAIVAREALLAELKKIEVFLSNA